MTIFIIGQLSDNVTYRVKVINMLKLSVKIYIVMFINSNGGSKVKVTLMLAV